VRSVGRKGQFSDPTAEIGEITSVFKKDMKGLNEELQVCQLHIAADILMCSWQT
jgi:hypothetical protein